MVTDPAHAFATLAWSASSDHDSTRIVSNNHAFTVIAKLKYQLPQSTIVQDIVSQTQFSSPS